ncbi:bifunctional DNA primase/polymerase [Sphingomonas daechungensis]|uniref:bifunctional DNA primase/polymerase n=1 Tax=Sphingomonas daechungensis TaxID=1176646 RepID=UPI0037845CE0
MTAATNDLASIRALRTRLWEAGFRAVPIYNPVPGQKDSGKRPHGLGWQTAARANPPACTRLPASPSATNTGILCDGFRVIDIDIEDQSRAAEVEAIAVDMFGSCPVRFRTNSGKRALFYRASEGEPSKLAITGEHGKIEILGKGQQFVAFGAHFTGAVLEWRGGEPGDFTAGDLPSVSEDEISRFLEAVRSIVGAKEDTKPAPTGNSDIGIPISEQSQLLRYEKPRPSGARERAAFEKALETECGLVASAGEGTRNDTLNKAAFNLSQMAAAGWGSPVEVNHALTDAARTCGLPAIEAAKTIRSGMEAGAQSPRPPLVDRREEREILDPSPLINGHTGQALTVVQNDDDIDPDDDDDEADEVLDEDLTHVPGFLGELIEAMVLSARRPSRRLALAAALPILGTVIGRRVAGPTRSGTHLYIIPTAATGAGKQHYLNAVERFMAAAGLSRHIGPSQFMSFGALNKFVEGAPLSICPQDEFGAVLKKISHPRASGHETMISGTLRSLWGASFETIRTPAYASVRSADLHSPALSLFAPTTADELFEGMKGRDLINGFMNRFLVIDAGERAAEREPPRDLRREAERLAPKLAEFYRLGTARRGNLSAHIDKNGDPDPEPGIIVPWQSQAANDLYLAMSEECNRRIDADTETGELYARSAEMALRIATIRACGEDPSAPTITETHMEWAGRLTMQSAELLCRAAGKHMVDPLNAAEFERKVLEKLRSSPGRKMRMRALYRTMSKNQRYAGDLDKTLKALASAGIVEVRKITGLGGSSVVVSLS